MARRLVVELLDAFAEIGLGDGDAVVGEEVAHAALLGEHRLALDQRLGIALAEKAQHDPVVLVAVLGPMHGDAIGRRRRLELLEIGIEVREGMLLDRRGETAQLLPLRQTVHLLVALLAHLPKPFVVKLEMFRGCKKAPGGFGMIDGAIAALDRAFGLRLPLLRLHRLPRRAGVGKTQPMSALVRAVIGGFQLVMKKIAAHCRAPFKTSAMWMNFIGEPWRAATPF